MMKKTLTLHVIKIERFFLIFIILLSASQFDFVDFVLLMLFSMLHACQRAPAPPAAAGTALMIDDSLIFFFLCKKKNRKNKISTQIIEEKSYESE